MKAVLNYKKPLFWICIALIIVLIGVVVLFFILPSENIWWQKSDSHIEGVSLKITEVEEGTSPGLTVEWTNESAEEISFGDSYKVYREEDGEWDYIGMSDSLLMGYILPPGHNKEIKNSFRAQFFLEAGKYRLESDVTGEDKNVLNQKVWLDFYLTEDFIDPPEIIRWQKNGSDVRGISLEIVDFDTSAENPSIVVKWDDNTGKDYGASPEYYIYKETNGKWESCGEGYWDAFSINPADDVWLWDYSLKNFDLSESGKYRFESTLSENEKIWVEFYLEEGLEIGKIHECYRYDSGDILSTPSLILREDNTYSLSFSSLSSYISFGTYEISENTLTLRSDDERGVFVFTVKGDTLVFHAEESKGVWGYRQPDGTSASTIPDGAVFEES